MSKPVKTAVLVPTFGWPKALKDTLENCLPIYKKYNFDVYVFDSNKDNLSYEVVHALQKNYDNLHYIRLGCFTHLDVKYLAMVQGKYFKGTYDYLFPCGDSNSLTEYSLDRIYPYLQEGVDVVNMLDLVKIPSTCYYTDANDFFNSKYFNIGLWGGCVYSKRVFDLTDEEWNESVAKWFSAPQEEFIGSVGFVLERISKLKNLKIIIPEMNVEPDKVLRRSRYKKRSFWRKDALQVIGIAYPSVYGKLPKTYTRIDEKLEALFRGNFKWSLFKFLKRRASFTLTDYYQYKKIVGRYCKDIVDWRVFLLALLPDRKMLPKFMKKK